MTDDMFTEGEQRTSYTFDNARKSEFTLICAYAQGLQVIANEPVRSAETAPGGRL